MASPLSSRSGSVDVLHDDVADCYIALAEAPVQRTPHPTHPNPPALATGMAARAASMGRALAASIRLQSSDPPDDGHWNRYMREPMLSSFWEGDKGPRDDSAVTAAAASSLVSSTAYYDSSTTEVGSARQQPVSFTTETGQHTTAAIAQRRSLRLRPLGTPFEPQSSGGGTLGVDGTRSTLLPGLSARGGTQVLSSKVDELLLSQAPSATVVAPTTSRDDFAALLADCKSQCAALRADILAAIGSASTAATATSAVAAAVAVDPSGHGGRTTRMIPEISPTVGRPLVARAGPFTAASKGDGSSAVALAASHRARARDDSGGSGRRFSVASWGSSTSSRRSSRSTSSTVCSSVRSVATHSRAASVSTLLEAELPHHVIAATAVASGSAGDPPVRSMAASSNGRAGGVLTETTRGIASSGGLKFLAVLPGVGGASAAEPIVASPVRARNGPVLVGIPPTRPRAVVPGVAGTHTVGAVAGRTSAHRAHAGTMQLQGPRRVPRSGDDMRRK